MTSPNADQLAEIEFVSGITGAGTVSRTSFDSWNGDAPATYGLVSGEAKWGAAVAGTTGELTVAFDAASHWTATEQQGFVAAMELWSAVADIHFDLVGNASAAGLVISRASDGSASEQTGSYYQGREATTRLGTLVRTSIAIDTSVYGFGPIGGALSVAGGYPWMTIEHELGHAIGLGHAGPYDDDGGSQPASWPTLGTYDSRAWSIMSYHDASTGNGGREPVTPMAIDIAAAQRVYGAATSGPLAGGGQVFGFHCNIAGDLAQFFDFSRDAAPVVTIWDGGDNNVLDLSGFASASRVSLVDGSLNDVGGLRNNLGIAFGTRIATVIGGSGNDLLSGNALGNLIEGGGGSDTLVGGSGNDHLYGNMLGGEQGAADGNDTITTGPGSNYVNGNAGNDVIVAGLDGSTGANRLYGGAGNDIITIKGAGRNDANGNADADTIDASAATGVNLLRGGAGNDLIRAGHGHDQILGDLGADTLVAGTGEGHVTLMTGGQDGSADLFVFHGVQGSVSLGGQTYYQEVTDYAQGIDHLALDYQPQSVQPLAAAYADVASAQAAAQAWLNAHPTGSVATAQVGSDTFLFYDAANSGPAIDSILRLDHVTAASIGIGDFTITAG